MGLKREQTRIYTTEAGQGTQAFRTRLNRSTSSLSLHLPLAPFAHFAGYENETAGFYAGSSFFAKCECLALLKSLASRATPAGL